MKKIIIIIFVLLTKFSSSQERKFKLVLDAGHGGKDSGAKKNNCIEKEIALDVIMRIGKILENYNDINFIYTRNTDEFIPLRTRAKMANDFEADLFVSVHCNASKSPKPFGSMTLVMGLSRNNMNYEIAKSENSVILQEDDYKKDYKGFDPNNPQTAIGLKIVQEETLMQSIDFASAMQDKFKDVLNRKSFGMHQQPLWVLDATVMPGVLIELGFLTNYKESQYMRSEEGKQNYAQIIAQNIIEYKDKILNTTSVPVKYEIKEPTIIEEVKPEEIKPVITDNNIASTSLDSITTEGSNPKTDLPTVEPKFRVQIGYTTTKLEPNPENFKGLNNIFTIEANNGFKYYYGGGQTKEECNIALKEAKKKGFKQAFIVEMNK